MPRLTKRIGLLLFLISVLAIAEAPELETAVRADDVALIETLLANGADPDTISESGTPVLVIAASRGVEETVRLLIAAGANPDSTTTGGLIATALMYASGGDNSGIASVLLGTGADVNIRDAMGDPAINWATYYGNTAYVEVLLNAGADANMRGHGNAFEIAIRRGHEDLVRLTAPATGNLRATSEFIELATKSLWTGNDQDAAASILTQPASLVLLTDSYGRPLAHVAALNDASQTIEVIVARQGGVDAPDVIDYTALMHAARAGHIRSAETLIRLGADVNHRGAPTGLSLTPLHLAAIGGNVEMVSLLLDAGAEIDNQGRDGGTALRWAMYEGKKETAITLIEAGADVDLTSEGAQAPRELAALMGWDDLGSLIEARETP